MKSHTQRFRILTRDCDGNGAWRVGAILETFQELAGAHCTLLGCGRNELLHRHAAWVLLRTHLEMQRYPHIGDEISVETFHMNARHGLFPRYFVIRDANNELLGACSSAWTLLNLDTRQALLDPEIESMLPDNSDMQPPLRLPGAVKTPQDAAEEQLLYSPQYTDLDANGHMNNAKYADLFCNTLGIETLRASEIQALTLIYTSEVKPGETLRLTLHKADAACRLTGLLNGKPAIDISGLLRPRQDTGRY